MPVTVQIIGSNRSLPEIEQIINQTEQGPFELVSLAIARVSGGDCSVAVFKQAPLAARAAITLGPVNGALSRDEQENQINAAKKQLVCYAALFVGGTPTNIAVLRG